RRSQTMEHGRDLLASVLARQIHGRRATDERPRQRRSQSRRLVLRGPRAADAEPGRAGRAAGHRHAGLQRDLRPGPASDRADLPAQAGHIRRVRNRRRRPRHRPGRAWRRVDDGTASPALADGEYAAIAYQPGASEGGTEAATAPRCFGVDTQPPAVSLTAPTAGAVLSGGSVTAHGGAGSAPHDRGQVSVLLFAGADTSVPPIQQVTVNRSGGVWDAAFSGLVPGAYSIRAEQSDEAGNVGLSGVVPFTIAAPSAPSGPSAAFSWYPAKPHPGEKVTLVSSSTDQASPITGYAWSLLSSAF